MRTAFLVSFCSLLVTAALPADPGPPGNNLRVNSMSCDAVWTAGQPARVHVSVMNSGGALGARLGIFLSLDANVTRFDVLLRSIVIPSYGLNTAYTDLALPIGQGSGKFWIGVIADYEQKVSETNENDNVASAEITTVGKPNLVITDFLLDRNISAGKQHSVSVTVKNVGSVAAGASRTGIVMGKGSVLGDQSEFLTEFATTALAPGASYVRQLTFRVPYYMTGYRYFGAVADIGNWVDESYNQGYKSVGRAVATFTDVGAFIEYYHPVYGDTRGPRRHGEAHFDSKGGVASISITAPTRSHHGYLLVWSKSAPGFVVDELTQLAFGFVNTQVFHNWYGKVDVKGLATATFRVPANHGVNVFAWTHSIWFQPQTNAIVGFGSNRILTKLY